MTIALESMAVAMPEVAGHPNRAAFRGVLTMVDVPSQRAPSGAKGHLVLLTRSAAESALPSLLGMALDYSPSLDRHDVRRKVGVITRAEIVGRDLELGGYLFARDFPEIVEEIAKSGRDCSLDCSRVTRARGRTLRAVVGSWKQRWTDGNGVTTPLQAAAKQLLDLTTTLKRSPDKRQKQGENSRPAIRAEACMASGAGGLGLSYEVADVKLTDSRAQIWTLEKVTFTGAAILRRDKAAYRDTWIELGR
jgi:hypothetical protein